jgi:hypothetical protein
MSKDRSPTDYLSDDWGMTPPDANNASGAGDTPDGPAPSVPYNQDVPLNPEWGMLGKGRGGFGHAEVVKETKGATWGMDRDDIAQGFERPESDGEGSVLGTRQPDGSFPQSIPTSNTHDRSDRSREFSKLEEGAHSGHDGARSSPGKQLIGSRENLG